MTGPMPECKIWKSWRKVGDETYDFEVMYRMADDEKKENVDMRNKVLELVRKLPLVKQKVDYASSNR